MAIARKYYESEGQRLPDVDQMVGITRHMERRRFQALMYEAAVAPSEDVLDIGCGSGYLLSQFLEHRGALVGVDLAESRLQKAKHRLESAGVRAELVQGTAEFTPFREATFDVVFSSEVLEHLEDPSAAVREAMRVLRPGGRYVVSVPNRGHIQWVQCVRCGEMTSLDGHLHVFDPCTLSELLIREGFRLVRCRGTYPMINNRRILGWPLRGLPDDTWARLDEWACRRFDKGHWLIGVATKPRAQQ